MKTLRQIRRWGSVALSFCALDLAAATATTDGTTLTIDVGSGESYAYSDAIPDGVTAIRKTGAGTCDFGVKPYRTYTGAIYVEAGILSGDPGVGTQGAFGSPSEIHVADGACLKLVNTWYPTGVSAYDGRNAANHGSQPCTPFKSTKLYVKGAGPDGNGAVWASAVRSQHNLFGGVTLEGDATFYSKTRWGIGGTKDVIFDMGGFTLTLKGENQFELGRDRTIVRNPGNVNLVSGTLLFENGNPLKKTGFVMEDGTFDALTNKTLTVSAGCKTYIYGSACPMKIHGSGTAGQSAQLVMGYGWNGGNPAGDVLGDVTADEGFRFDVTYGTSGATGGAFRGRVDVTCLNVCGTTAGWASSDTFAAVVSNAQAGASFSNLLASASKLRFVDAGEVKITGVAKATSWNASVPDENASPIRIGQGCGNNYPAYMSVEGQTVVKAAADTAAGTYPACVVSMVGTDDFDFGILDVKDGGAVYADFFTGNKETQGAAVYLSGEGSKIVSRGGEACRNWFGRGFGYATLDIRGGSYQTDGWVTFGENGRGFFVQRGGEVTYGCGTDNGSKLRLGRRRGAGAHYIGLGGTFKAGEKGAAQVDLGFCDSFGDSDGYVASFTVGGAADGTCDVTVKNLRAWMVTNSTATSASTALVNLNAGGTLACEFMRWSCADVWEDSSKLNALMEAGGVKDSGFYVNFNGGTLRARTSTTKFFGLNGSTLYDPTRLTVFAGGARFDTAGFDVSISLPFEKPYGKGIASVAFTDGDGVKPVGTRSFRIAGSGVAASVVTDFDAATRTDAANALVCSSGFGFGDDVTVQLEKVKTFKSVSTNLTATVTMIDFDASDYEDGGFTKAGEGTLKLQGKNTYRGKTRVEGGALEFTDADGFPGGDVEFSAEALLSGTAKLTAKKLAFRSGAKFRVTGAEKLLTAEPKKVRGLIEVTGEDATLAALPQVEYVKSDGSAMEAPDRWWFRLAGDGTRLDFGYRYGATLIIR